MHDNLHHHLLCSVFAAAFLFAPSIVSAQGSAFDALIDPKDGALDTSKRLEERTGFLPVPIVISDPSLGYGAGLALAFFHEQETEEDEEDAPRDVFGDPMLSLPPSVSVVAAAYTENESWAVGGGHLGSYKRDTIRYEGILGLASLNLAFYGIGDVPTLDSSPAGFNIDGFLTQHELKFRWRESKVFVGARYDFSSPDVKFEIPTLPPVLNQDQLDDQNGGLTGIVEIDTRDNILTPYAGQSTKLEVGYFSTTLGGDSSYWKGRVRSLSYWDLSDKLNLGVRGDLQFTDGEPPFYALPYIQLRGIGALRYQDETVLTGELELRYAITHRWTAVAFGGMGVTTGSSVDGYQEGAGGAGFRYLLARRLGLHAGIDVAVGPEDTVVYLQVGHAWAR